MTSQSLTLLKKMALIEGFSLLCLLAVAMPLKYLGHEPMGVKIMGPVHGMLYLGYLLFLLKLVADRKITTKTFVLGFFAGTIPFGFLFFDRLLSRPIETSI